MESPNALHAINHHSNGNAAKGKNKISKNDDFSIKRDSEKESMKKGSGTNQKMFMKGLILSLRATTLQQGGRYYGN